VRQKECWGANSYGELGTNSMNGSPVPVQVPGLASGVTAVSVGTGSACAVTTGGGVLCWGDNGFGGLGNGSINESLVPVQVTGLTSGVSSVSVGNVTACAVTTGGGVMCWGDGYNGQLGNGMANPSSVPVQVTGLTSGVNSVSVGGRTVCAVTSAGQVLCWGDNQYGTVGDNSTTDALVPTQVMGLIGTATSVSVGNDEACAVTGGGGVMCWGYGPFGELGNGAMMTSLVPVHVTGLTSGATAVSAGYYAACVVACGVQCWGGGPLGNNAMQSTDAPVSVDLLGASPCP
jgi:alpha-tubulin suppressor-like RCC1 family protein